MAQEMMGCTRGRLTERMPTLRLTLSQMPELTVKSRGFCVSLIAWLAGMWRGWFFVLRWTYLSGRAESSSQVGCSTNTRSMQNFP